ncbi:MAG: MFS transporter [Acidimicrobiales bacterium]|jgi:MFS family permease
MVPSEQSNPASQEGDWPYEGNIGGPAIAPPVDAAHGLSSLRPFHHRNYLLVWWGGMVSVIGSWMQTVAVGALVVAHTGKATWAVVIAAAGFLPIGLLSPVGGALADRVPRRAALVAGNLLAGAVALTIALLVAEGWDSAGILALLVMVQGSVSAMVGPFEQAILPDLVPRPEFLAAVSLNSAQFNLGRVVGPALAGVTIAGFGYPVAFLANAASFLAVVVALLFVRLSPPSGRAEQTGLLESLRMGRRAARAEPGCRAAIGTIVVVALLASPFIALVPAMAHRLTHDGARGIASATGLLTTAQGIGAVAGALALAPLAARFGRGRTLTTSLAVLPLVLALYGFAPSLAWAVPALFLVGLVYINVLSGLSTVVQLRAPTELRGRVLSLYLVALGVAYPVGSLVQGPLADTVGLAWSTAGAAVLLAVALAVLRVARPGVFQVLAAPAPREVPSRG